MADNPVFEIDASGKEWRHVPGFVGVYVVSELGEVKRIIPGAGRAKVGGILRPGKNRKGYHAVLLCHLGRKKTAQIHCTVCEAFHGPKPTPAHQAAHRDDNKDNNSKGNLYWATPLENTVDRRRNGRITRGSHIGRAKLKETDIPRIFAMREAGMLNREIGEKFGVAPHTISRIVAGKRWGHIEGTAR